MALSMTLSEINASDVPKIAVSALMNPLVNHVMSPDSLWSIANVLIHAIIKLNKLVISISLTILPLHVYKTL